jgi:hypothetical protein
VTADREPSRPERLVCGRYRLRRRIGAGGMGTVWLAHDEVLNRPVAVKEVTLLPGGDPAQRAALGERLVREARAAAAIDHPNAVRVYDVADDAGRPWIVMELLTGRTLDAAVRADGPLPPAQVARIGMALLDALEAAHRVGVLHRDVKPANVQLCDNGRVVLTDFGIARQTGDPALTRTGEIVGSPAYMSPERARGGPLGPAADLFSLGATLYAAVEGRAPFQREEPIATLHAVVTEDPPPAPRAGPLAPVLAHLLAKDPAGRPGPAQVRAALQEVAGLADTGATQVLTPVNAPAASPTPAPARSARPPRRGVLGALAVLAALLVAGALVVPRLVGGGESPGGGTSRAAADGPFDPGQGSVPADWVRYTADGQSSPSGGWSIATPGWTPQPAGGFLRLRQPGYGYVAVGTRPGAGSPRGLVDGLAGSFGATHTAYHNLGVRDVRFRGRDAADWEFTYRDEGADLHASVRAFVVAGTGYLIWFQTKASDWAGAQEQRRAMLASFRT